MRSQENTVGAGYSKISIGVHWFMLLLLAVVYALIELREFYPRGSEIRETFKAWHFTMGLLVFGLVWIRLVARLRTSRPPQPRSAADWLAAAMHLALYVLMVLMPVIGWMVLSASGKPIPFFGIDLPALIPKNKALGEQLKEVHELETAHASDRRYFGHHLAPCSWRRHACLRSATPQSCPILQTD